MNCSTVGAESHGQGAYMFFWYIISHNKLPQVHVQTGQKSDSLSVL